MTSQNFERVAAILLKQAQATPAEMTADTALEALGIDSFDFIEAVFLIEDAFGIEIDTNFNDVGARLKTVGDVVAAVDRLVAAKAARAQDAGGQGTMAGAVPA